MRAVHIGFPKTATTFLQTRVFPALVDDGFVYVGKEAAARCLASLIDDDDTIFDAHGLRERVEWSAPSGANALFSFEGLTGHHYRCGFVNRSQIARRLRAAGFDRALITIRNQFDVLESAYKQYVKSGGVLRYRDYVTFDPTRPRYLDARYFDYRLIYELYARTFGRDRVLVLQYERLGEPDFVERLRGFVGAASITIPRHGGENRSLSYEKTAVLRLCNHWIHSSYRPSSLLRGRVSSERVHGWLRRAPFGNSTRSFLGVRERREIAEFYADSNRALAAAAGITLADTYP